MKARLNEWLTDGELQGLLRNRVFLRLFSGRVITDAGDSLYYIGSMWLVWELTQSPFYTGLAGALLQVPNVLSFLVGPLVDRWQLRSILLATQLINCLGVLLIPIAAWTGRLSVWLVLIMMPILDFVNGFVYPAQNAALPSIVGDEQLTRANSLFSTTIRGVDMVSNAVAGALIALVGAVTLFVVDSITFALAAILFVGVTVQSDTEDVEDTSENEDSVESDDSDDAGYLTELRRGVGYVRQSVIWVMLVGMMVSNFATVAGTVILPSFADSLGGPTAYGLLFAAMGAGTIAGAAGTFLVEDYPLSRIAVFNFLLSGSAWFAAIAVPGLWPTVALFFAAAAPVGAFNVLFGSMYQSAADEALLGRVSTLERTLSSAMMPAGALLGGAAATAFGTRTVMYAVGVVLASISVYYLVHPKMRSLPPVAEMDEATLGLTATDSAD